MKRSVLTLSITALLNAPLAAFEFITPDTDLSTAPIEITDPDADVTTLGQVEFFVDLSASHDDMLTLKVRRADLRLTDGREPVVFGVHKEAGLIVLAGGPVRHVSTSSVAPKDGDRETLVLFHGKAGQIIAPRKRDLAVFGLDFNPLPFSYKPLAPPGDIQLPVNILLDISGSMSGHMEEVQRAAQSFMQGLPAFARCRVTLFNHNLKPLSKSREPYADAAHVLDAPITTSGSTALFEALASGFEPTIQLSNGRMQIIAIAVTDGFDTDGYEGGLEGLKNEKERSGAKLFVFWSGSYAKGRLKDLPDLEFESTDNLEQELERFLRSLGISISGLQTLPVGSP
jgi:uncharacterized protein YegL